MTYRLLPDEEIAEGVRRIATEQVDRALAELDDAELDDHETVHQVRKRCKKVRGLVRLVRPALGDTYAAVNGWFRDAARRLSDVRDAQAMREFYDDLTGRFDDQIDRTAFASIRSELTRQLHRFERSDLEERLARFRADMVEARERIDGWRLDASGWSAVEGGLRKTYRRARERMADASDDPTPERFHEWRKRVKYHWYHMRLLRELWWPVLEVRVEASHDLSDLLGDAHDAAVFVDHLRQAPDRYGRPADVEVMTALANGHRADLERRALGAGGRLLAEKPRALVRRFGRYWDVMREQAGGDVA